MAYDNILVETRERVGVICINRPQRMNALNGALMAEMTAALFALDADDGIGCIVVTGNERSHSPRKSHRFPCRS